MSDQRSFPPAVPADTVRAAVSVALVVYVVGLVLTVLGNSTSGSSTLVRTLKGRLFAPWLVPAWLDLGFDHHLTHGLPEDADHSLAIRPTGASGPAGGGLRWPAAAATGERAARWRRLAKAIATGRAGDPAVLAAAVGRGAFADLDTTDVELRVLRRPLPERDAPPGDDPARPAYAARVRLVDGELHLLPREARGELAPLLRERRAGP
jgi:hypothetical protein